MNTAILSFAVWFLIISSVYNSEGNNLALNRPVYQSSTQEGGEADIAVDGICNRSASFNETPFPAAHGDDPPGGPNWFVVDLGQEHYVQYVVVSNRVDCCGERLDYFIVGVTNSFSPSEPPVRDQYPLCGQYNNATPTGAKLTVYCSSSTPPGQFVIIQQPADGAGYLTICELEVHGYEAGESQLLSTGSCDPPTRTSTIVLAVLLGLFILVCLILAIDDVRLRVQKHTHPESSP